MSEYAGILIFAFFAFAVTLTFLVLTSVLGPKRPNPAKDQPFECGEKPFHNPSSGISVHFYLIAMLFIIFDIEIAFLFPWVVLFQKLGAAGLAAIGMFVFVILTGYVHAIKRGALDPE